LPPPPKQPVVNPPAKADPVLTDDDLESDDEAGDVEPLPTTGVYVGYQDPAQIRDLYKKPAPTPKQSTASPSVPPTSSDDATKSGASHPKDQAIGCYAPVKNCAQGGRLNKASKLEKETNTYYLSRPDIGRDYGTYATVQFVTWLSKKVQELVPNYRVRIGDVAQEKGGPIYSYDSQGRGHLAHKSHQNGLDADLGYIMDFKEGVPTLAVSGREMSSHVRKADLWETFKLAIHSQAVSRIFVDPAVKAGFCSYARSQGEFDSEREVLRRIQPLSGHTAHFHLRLRCPKDNPRCLDEIIPATTPLGC
jgi:penicillin-insensitive murein endopeptidase